MECSINPKEIRYDLFCDRCKHHSTVDTDKPCNECLTECVRMGSIIPVNFEEEEI